MAAYASKINDQKKYGIRILESLLVRKTLYSLSDLMGFFANKYPEMKRKAGTEKLNNWHHVTRKRKFHSPAVELLHGKAR